MKIYVLDRKTANRRARRLSPSMDCASTSSIRASVYFLTRRVDAFIYNATPARIDLLKVDMCILSHAHDDHTVGLPISSDQ